MIPLNGKRYASPLKHLEHVLHPWSAFLILPLFAFANAGVSLEGIYFSALLNPLPMGIILGLFVGKPLGIFTISWLAVKSGIAQLPQGVNFRQIFAVSILCGIGFTMSMFIASLAFEHGGLDYGSYSRLGILVGPPWRPWSAISPCAWRSRTGRPIKARRGYEKTRMVSHAGEPCTLGR